MSLIQVTTPIQDISGTKHNCFKGYIPTFFELKRADIEILNISSSIVDSDLLVKIEVVGSLDSNQNIKVGDSISIFGLQADGYEDQSAEIISIEVLNTVFVVDIAYLGDTTGGSLNYRKNWFTDYRLVESNTATDQQTTVKNLFDFTFTSQSEVDGKVELDISVANDKNKPSLEGVKSTNLNPNPSDLGLNKDMFLFFKIQWREVYLEFTGQWTSPDVDDPMIVFHASDPFLQEGGIEIPFQNNIMLQNPIEIRFWDHILPKINFLRSRLGDANFATKYHINVTQFDITKTQVQLDPIDISNFNGLHTVDLSSISVDSNTVFVTFEADFIIDGGEYEAAEYQNDEYNVTT